jgi:hypothetical protein
VPDQIELAGEKQGPVCIEGAHPANGAASEHDWKPESHVGPELIVRQTVLRIPPQPPLPTTAGATRELVAGVDEDPETRNLRVAKNKIECSPADRIAER